MGISRRIHRQRSLTLQPSTRPTRAYLLCSVGISGRRGSSKALGRERIAPEGSPTAQRQVNMWRWRGPSGLRWVWRNGRDQGPRVLCLGRNTGRNTGNSTSTLRSLAFQCKTAGVTGTLETSKPAAGEAGWKAGRQVGGTKGEDGGGVPSPSPPALNLSQQQGFFK